MKDQESINLLKVILSIVLLTYIVLYTFRLIIGSFRYSRIMLEYKGNKAIKNPLRLLLHMHLPEKNKPFNSIYLPILMLKNQIFNVFIVVFSLDPIYQILSCGVLLLVFTIYSIIFCPYRLLMRVCFHIT